MVPLLTPKMLISRFLIFFIFSQGNYICFTDAANVLITNGYYPLSYGYVAACFSLLYVFESSLYIWTGLHKPYFLRFTSNVHRINLHLRYN